MVNWGIKRLDDYLQRNPNKTYANYYQTVADWIRQELLKRQKAEAEQKEVEQLLVDDTEWGEGELARCLSETFILP